MAAGPIQVADRTEHGTEARSVPQALEPLQTSLMLGDGLGRVLDATVLAPAAEMRDGRHHGGFRRRVDQAPDDLALPPAPRQRARPLKPHNPGPTPQGAQDREQAGAGSEPSITGVTMV